jgi:L-asparaginase/beta-aspartyl-peptidase (threonine type)
MSWVVLTHGGAASPASNSDGCVAAAEKAREVLAGGGDALAAALVATVHLEDDPRFNAGTGSSLRLDGKLVQMDAGLMVSDGRIGAVACIEAVKNPILVAARVTETPHILLVGEGATAFARRLGFAAHDVTASQARDKYGRAMADLLGKGDGSYAEDASGWHGRSLAEVWNFVGEPPEALRPPIAPRAGSARQGCDTVGAVVRDAHGVFCATASTGGTVFMLRGRVGDSPLVGSGYYAGEHGAVAATGVGEEIARRVLAKAVYDWLAAGVSAREAADRAVALFPDAVDVGVLVAGRADAAIASNRSMAAAQLASG